MALPVLLALEPDHKSLRFLETQLIQRYSSDYRVECLGDPDLALLRLTELADVGESVALVLASKTEIRAGWLLEHVRELHPHAKCALLVPSDVWNDQSSAGEIRAAIALDASTITSSGPLVRRMRSSTRPSPVFSSSGRPNGVSCPRQSTSSARPGRVVPMS